MEGIPHTLFPSTTSASRCPCLKRTPPLGQSWIRHCAGFAPGEVSIHNFTNAPPPMHSPSHLSNDFILYNKLTAVVGLLTPVFTLQHRSGTSRPTTTRARQQASTTTTDSACTALTGTQCSPLRLESGNKDMEQASPRLLHHSTLQAGTERPTVLYVQSLGPMYRTCWEG